MCKRMMVLISVFLVMVSAGTASALLVDGYREWTGTLQLGDLFGLEITETGHAKFTARVNQDGCNVTIAAGGILETTNTYKLPDEYPQVSTNVYVNGTWNAHDIQFMGTSRSAYIYVGATGVINLQVGYGGTGEGSSYDPLIWLADNSLLVDPSLDPEVWYIQITDMGGGASQITAEALASVVGFDSVSSSALESVSPAELTVTLSGADEGQTYTVDYAVTGGTAEGNGVDYILESGTLTFNPGESSKTISIDIVDDGLDEEAETIVVELSNPTGPYVVLGIDQHTYTILDRRPTVGFDTGSSSEAEDAGTIETPVSLSFASTLTVTVDYAVTGGTATGGGVDYILEPGTLTFEPGETSKTISVELVDDGVVEGPETVVITLSNPTNAKPGNITQFTYTIFDSTQIIPVGWWKFDEGEGLIARDSSGNNLDGSLQGNAEWVEGHVGSGALSLLGGCVLVSDSPALRPSRLTVTAWVKLSSPQVRFARLLEKGYDNHETYNFQGGGYGMSFIMLDTGGDNHGTALSSPIPADEWAFLAGVYNGSKIKIYLNGCLSGSSSVGSFTPYNSSGEPLCIGGRPTTGGVDRLMNGMVDDVRIYNHGLSDNDIKEMFAWISGDTSIAALPVPKHQSINISPYTTLSWFPGKGATSHDVYLGTDFDDVNDATTGSDEFMGNVDVNSYDPPGLLELGQTYYWRVDELSDGETSKGTVWQFTVDDGKASNPNPPDGLANTPVDANLGWTAGNYATSHDVYFGTDQTSVADANTVSPEYKGNQAETSYDPGTLEENVTYYWRVDEIGDDGTFAKGDVWSFITVGAFHLQVDLGLPVCGSTWDNVIPVPGTVKEGWWGRVFWGDTDMYMHDFAWEDGWRGIDPPESAGVAGSGVHFALDSGSGDGGYHIHGMCRCNLAGDCCATGSPSGDPIANGWFHNIDWGGECTGDIHMRITGLPPGKYELISYHNHWEPCSQGSRNCLDCYSQMPPMTGVYARSLGESVDCGSAWEGAGTGTGVTSLKAAYNVDVTSVLSDDNVATSTIEFETDGSDVLVVYDGGDNTYPDPARTGREGSKGILNAFELILVEPAGPESWRYRTQCHGDTDDDGEVKGSDFLALKNSWYKCYPDPDYDPSADFDRDGCVKASDFLIFKSNWYKSVEPNCPSGGTWPPQP